jgi:NIMA (never in mitosis gene a)-related kinase 1/4/5
MNVSKILTNGDLAKTKAGSPLYTCPEVWNKEEGYNEKCDVWSLGIVAYELCCLKVPYEASSIEELIRKQKTVRLKNIPMGYSAALNELIHEMLQYYPKRRVSAERIKATCLRNLKLENEDVLVPLDPLIDTIVIP